MKSKQIKESVPPTYALIFDKGDEVMSALSEFAERENLLGSHFTAVGAFERVVLGYFDRERKDYKRIPIEEQGATSSGWPGRPSGVLAPNSST